MVTVDGMLMEVMRVHANACEPIVFSPGESVTDFIFISAKAALPISVTFSVRPA